ncbi:MAG: hypothetical protein PHO91_04425 [Patescibacteria group bacterium]|nr:hypothetical protein [Patescibacteria group bacterium]
MINKNTITILSTFSNDKLVSRDGLLLCEQKGGPAFYLSQVFQREEAAFLSSRNSHNHKQLFWEEIACV